MVLAARATTTAGVEESRGCTVTDVGVPLEGVNIVTVPLTLTGRGAWICTVAAVAGLPVRAMRTGSPSASAAMVTATPPFIYTVLELSRMFSEGRARFSGRTVSDVGVPLEGVNAVTVPRTTKFD
jgi:hypothetical protein